MKRKTVSKSRKAYYNHALPFIASDANGKHLSSWAIKGTGDGPTDFLLGYRLALIYIEWAKDSAARGEGGWPELATIVSDIENGPDNHAGLGFICAIDKAAVHGVDYLKNYIAKIERQRVDDDIAAARLVSVRVDG